MMENTLLEISTYQSTKEMNWGYSTHVLKAWKETLPHKNFVPSFYSYDKILEVWNTPLEERFPKDTAHYYEGRLNSAFVPGKVDLNNIIEIGSFDPESPIVLCPYDGNIIAAYLTIDVFDVWVKCAESLGDLFVQLDKIDATV